MPTMEEMNEWREKWKKERTEFNKELEELRRKDWEIKGVKPFDTSNVPKKYHDHPNTMENGTATLFWIVAMIVGALFKGNWVIWIVATLIWFKFITRHDK